ncbi:hypothetical protein JBW_03259 [Pelosinus fermentans JBW45]|uniref:Uncharacterized protein n=1 Tax=Pelosinus fermentans JBW45 TaxID=1192197 RepID=I8TWT1_9FIRM|nr:hypothetical protein JBW_03259 [Pelosinus fermentans JBW45]
MLLKEIIYLFFISTKCEQGKTKSDIKWNSVIEWNDKMLHFIVKKVVILKVFLYFTGLWLKVLVGMYFAL